MTAAIDDLASQIRGAFLREPFGIVQFWGLGMMPPNDQAYELVSTHVDGDRLDLVFVHESHRGLPGVISIWEPAGLEGAPAHVGRGIAIRSAKRLKLDDAEASDEGAQFRAATSRGAGLLPKDDAPALVLAR